MKILVMKSSGNTNGSSSMLADEFARGAKEAGHCVITYDLMKSSMNPCHGCGYCGMNGPCAYEDDYELELKGMIESADMLAFAFPIYYYGWPAQTKIVIDRFFSHNETLRASGKKAVMLTVAADTEDVFDESITYFKRMCKYMNFEPAGMVTGYGCAAPEITKASEYPAKAYELGKNM